MLGEGGIIYLMTKSDSCAIRIVISIIVTDE